MNGSGLPAPSLTCSQSHLPQVSTICVSVTPGGVPIIGHDGLLATDLDRPVSEEAESPVERLRKQDSPANMSFGPKTG